MPIKHRAKHRVPVDLEPSVLEHLEATARSLGLPRTTLLRILVKYSLYHLDDAIKCGDTIRWQPPMPALSSSDISSAMMKAFPSDNKIAIPEQPDLTNKG